LSVGRIQARKAEKSRENTAILDELEQRPGMDEIRRLRELAADLRRRAAREADPETVSELLDLADHCERTANQLEGDGSRPDG
jgi:hypothetical protein